MAKVFLSLLVLMCQICIQGVGSDVVLGCDQGWVAADTYCYLYNNQDMVAWAQASVECQRRYSNILRIETTQQLDTIKARLPDYTSDGFWTAMNDKNPGGAVGGDDVWLWLDDEYVDSKVLTWNKEPDDVANERCAAINTQGTFSDEDCTRKYPYICEFIKDADTNCPMNWLIATDKCVMVSNFTDPTQRLNWSQAKQKCNTWPLDAGLQAKLLTIDSQEDVIDIQQYIPLWTQTTLLYWTSLNSQQKVGQWQWSDGTALDPSLITWTTEPNNLAGRENCGLLLQDGSFSDRDCNQRNNYICYKRQLTLTGFNDMGCNEWTRAGHKCIYFYENPKKTWTDAKQFCQSMSGSLYRIETEDDLHFIGMQSRTARLSWGNYWIGLNDRSKEGTYVWDDGSSPKSNLLKWNSDPNDFNGDEDCAAMGKDGVFGDAPCNREGRGYICEKPLTGSGCPKGWINPQQVFGNQGAECYFIGQKWVTWTEAIRRCTDESGDGTGYLFGLSNKEESVWLLQQLLPIKTAPLQWWSGYTDAAVEGVWTHYMSQENDPVAISKFVVWNTEPNNYNGNEDCVTVLYGGRLNDEGCDSQHAFICQRPVGSGGAPGQDRLSVTSSLLAIICTVAGTSFLKNMR